MNAGDSFVAESEEGILIAVEDAARRSWLAGHVDVEEELVSRMAAFRFPIASGQSSESRPAVSTRRCSFPRRDDLLSVAGQKENHQGQNKSSRSVHSLPTA